jgi:glutamate formiminotransferase/formiminotetrahydrofolate cyclodeaminase
MAECVEMARRLGRRVGEGLDIPVYLYEEAATRPERQNLENIRRGQYEALKEELATQPTRTPDFGPARVGTAGATVIGARHPLIAFNVYLTTGEVSIAKKIAKAVRFSSGGLRYVKALGLLVNGRAQVSMNLTNYRETPVARVVETIRREAGRYGVNIHHSELVGLIPQDALQDASIWYLQLDGFEPEQVLERRLARVAAEADRAGSGGAGFLERLAAGTPAPGGGSAAAYSAAMGAALVGMTARLTIGKKKYAGVEAQMQALLEETEMLRHELEQAVQQDAAAFEAVMEAYRLPKGTAEEQAARLQAVEGATLHATEVPLNVARRAVRVMELASEVVRLGNLNAITDAATGFTLARAALAGTGLNVRANLQSLQGAKSLPDPALLERMGFELEAFETRAGELGRDVERTLHERADLRLKVAG